MMVYTPPDPSLEHLDVVVSQWRTLRDVRPLEAHPKSESIALVIDPAQVELAAEILRAAQTSCPRRLVVMDMAAGSPGVAARSDWVVRSGLATINRQFTGKDSVVLAVGLDHEELPRLVDSVDRILVLVAEGDAKRLANRLGRSASRAEVALVTPWPRLAPTRVDGLRVARAVQRDRPARDIAWLGRHLARTKLGIALGAGGAKGFAHIGALKVLEEAGYTIDYVAGTSIGSVVGAWLALGNDAWEIEDLMRRAFSPENVAAMFARSLSGLSAGLEVFERLCRETTGDCTFDDLEIPLTALAVDLNSQQPVPIREGPLWQAVVASSALAGLYPPVLRDSQRLIDGWPLIPVPTQALIEAGADVTIAVNLMSRDTLPAWPGRPEPPRGAAPPKSGSRLLDSLLEVMDLVQLDCGLREAAKADVAITPRFGPATWRDFHLADLFLDAGRAAAAEQLPSVRALTRT